MLLCFGQTKLRSFYAYKNLFNGYMKVDHKILQGMYFRFFFSFFFFKEQSRCNSSDVPQLLQTHSPLRLMHWSCRETNFPVLCSTRSPFVTLLSGRAQTGRWSSFGKRAWFNKPHIVLIISFYLFYLLSSLLIKWKKVVLYQVKQLNHILLK